MRYLKGKSNVRSVNIVHDNTNNKLLYHLYYNDK